MRLVEHNGVFCRENTNDAQSLETAAWCARVGVSDDDVVLRTRLETIWRRR